jgi:hypothetical protein
MTRQFANNTLPVDTWFPLDDAEMTLFKTLQTIKVKLYIASIVVVLVLLTFASITLYENRKDLRPKAKNGSWVKTILTSKMAVAIIIFVHLICTAAALLAVVLTNYAPNQSLCTFGVQLSALFYVFALWSTYVMFVARGYAAHGRPLEGWKGWVAFAVHVGTACAPLLFPLGIYGGWGTFSQIACVQNVLATLGVVFMVADTALSLVGRMRAGVFELISSDGQPNPHCCNGFESTYILVLLLQHARTHTRTQTQTHRHTRLDKDTYAHTNTRIYTHKYLHTHTHTPGGCCW